MKTPRTSFAFFFLMRVVLLAVFGVGLLAVPKLAAAQGGDIVDVDDEDVSGFCYDEVECSVITISTIFDTSSSTTIYISMESYTDNSDLFDNYDWYEVVAGELFDDDSNIGGADEADAYDAYWEGDASINPDNGDQSFAWPVLGYLCDAPNDCYQVTEAEADVDIGAPDISSKQPSYMFVGTSGTLTLGGTDFVDPFYENETTLNITHVGGSGSGFSYTAGSGTATQVTASYTVALTATTGNWEAGLSYYQGESGSYFSGVTNFTVGDPTPSITSVSPGSWNAGQSNIPVTISGSYFGSNPQLTVAGGGATATIKSHSDTGQPGGAQIVAYVTVPACAQAGSVTITVISTGYNGTGFTPAYSGQSSSSTSSATIVPAPAGAPTITLNGATVSGKTTNVVVGQGITLKGAVPTQACMTVASQKWSLPTGNAVGGYVAQTNPPLGTAEAVPTNVTSASYGPFYWVTAGTFAMTYQYTLTNGLTSPVSTATLKPAGLSSVKVYTCGGSGIGVGGCTANGALGKVAIIAGPELAFGGTANNIGIEFTASATAPPGNFQWVQEITGDTWTQTPANGGAVQTCNPPEVPAAGVFPGLDTKYPYPYVGTPAVTNDNPWLGLTNTYKNVSRTFSAQMYLMWVPTAAAGCSGGGCTIPVPLGSLKWKVNSAAKLTNSAHNTWAVTSGSGSAASFAASSSYPAWTSWVSYQGNAACH